MLHKDYIAHESLSNTKRYYREQFEPEKGSLLKTVSYVLGTAFCFGLIGGLLARILL